MPFLRSAYCSPVRSSPKTIVIVAALPCRLRDARVDVPDNARDSRGDHKHGPAVQPWFYAPMYQIIGHYPIVSPTGRCSRNEQRLGMDCGNAGWLTAMSATAAVTMMLP
jgi:hypothetical protein